MTTGLTYGLPSDRLGLLPGSSRLRPTVALVSLLDEAGVPLFDEDGRLLSPG